MMLSEKVITLQLPTVDATLSDLKKFQDFLRRNFKGKYDRYEV